MRSSRAGSIRLWALALIISTAPVLPLSSAASPSTAGRLFDGAVGARTEVAQDILSWQRRARTLASRSLLMSVHRRAKSGHRPMEYDEAKRVMFSRLYRLRRNGASGVVAFYSEVFVQGRSSRGADYPERGDRNGDGFVDAGGMNAEHIWPQSYFEKKGPMRSDLFHLRPTFIHVNSERGRLPFGEVAASEAEYATSAGARRGRGLFEPPDSAKGRVARMMLYFYTRYLGSRILPRSVSDRFWNSRVRLFLRWNREYPPDALERGRNDLLERIQGNRNPYVDDPGLADRIGVEAFLIR